MLAGKKRSFWAFHFPMNNLHKAWINKTSINQLETIYGIPFKKVSISKTIFEALKNFSPHLKPFIIQIIVVTKRIKHKKLFIPKPLSNTFEHFFSLLSFLGSRTLEFSFLPIFFLTSETEIFSDILFVLSRNGARNLPCRVESVEFSLDVFTMCCENPANNNNKLQSSSFIIKV